MTSRSAKWLPIAAFVASILIASCGGGGGGGIGGGNGSTNGSGGDGPLGCPLDSYSPNYLAADDPSTGDRNEVHWWNHFPLKVFFRSSPNIQGRDLNSIVLDGMNSWRDVAGVQLATETSNEGSADVTVDYVTVSGPPSNTWIGQTSWSFTPSTGQTFAADTQLKIWNSMSVAEVVDGLRSTAQHEFGHALFLGGHSPFSSDSMFPSASLGTYRPLTERDGNSLLSAYCGSFGNRAASNTPREPLVRRTISSMAR